ncbi:DNA cytosine methyltransferase [Stenotrophomonas sp.]|uniref:DNA cytosine methyltransferase n=1 Tax=Stenotrophomonas sp. TaxID=69392 RepID=UPI0028AFC0F1|nr:DNA cytosine methyltransferase [Stenotrophomonas sp.]
MKAPAPERRTSLRLSAEQHEAIERLCHQDGGKVPMSSWIARAIEDKIARDTGVAETPGVASGTGGHRFYEFFAGGGMARAGLGPDWQCLFANDFEPMKGRAYRENWNGGHDLLVDDINNVSPAQLADEADLAWASFPCQDLSLAGAYKGIGHWQDKQQTRSGTFWVFWRLMQSLQKEGRAPRIIVLENVYGVLTSNEGRDFAAIGTAFSSAGYRFGALMVDARHFVPQSRPRVFIVGVRDDVALPASLLGTEAHPTWHPPRMQEAVAGLSKAARKQWLWWNLPTPPARALHFVDVIEDAPTGVKWDTAERTQKLLGMMSEANRKKVREAQKAGRRMVGGVYKRTRLDEEGNKVQRAEVRFDDIAGCLRTPSGGSSRQSILVVEGRKIRSRLLSPREAARLMGLPDSYRLPPNYNDAYHIAGDGVAVPVVRHLAEHIFEPVLRHAQRAEVAA